LPRNGVTGAAMSGPDISKAIYLLIIGGMTAGIVFLSLRGLIGLARLVSAKPTQGRIVRKRIDSDDGTFYYVTYAFEDAAGGHHQREIQLGKANYDRLAEGQPTSIVYETSNPKNSYLADPRFRKSHFMAMCGWLLLAALLAFVAYSFVTQCVILDSCPPESP
jgi:hypothetical protein